MSVKKEKLNEKQDKFCKLYVSDREFYGNWVQCYIEVYKPDESKPNWYKTSCQSASKLLSNPKVTRRIAELLEKDWLNDSNVSKQLLFLINQFSDFNTKLSAIRHFDNLNAKIEKAKQKALTDGDITKEVLTKIIIEQPNEPDKV